MQREGCIRFEHLTGQEPFVMRGEKRTRLHKFAGVFFLGRKRFEVRVVRHYGLRACNEAATKRRPPASVHRRIPLLPTRPPPPHPARAKSGYRLAGGQEAEEEEEEEEDVVVAAVVRRSLIGAIRSRRWRDVDGLRRPGG